ncbi:MAG: hypothetical protein K0S20_763 [Patescibacteria group bacterium]|nr:hypothetical protein [Patescibacteria group bacterium]
MLVFGFYSVYNACERLISLLVAHVLHLKYLV